MGVQLGLGVFGHREVCHIFGPKMGTKGSTVVIKPKKSRLSMLKITPTIMGYNVMICLLHDRQTPHFSGSHHY